MHIHVIENNYNIGDSFGYLLASDLHIGSPAHDSSLLKREFDRAKELGFKILINGDWGEFIMNGDRKRYTPSHDVYGADNYINRIIEECIETLKPYADIIEFIGCGNHEVSVQKFHNFDPTQNLIFALNRECGTNIKHGQYCGFTRFKYSHASGGRVRSKIMYYNHGQGGTAEISKGAIDINRHMTTKDADIIWIGHKHTKLLLPCETQYKLNKENNLTFRKRAGFISGAYVKQGSVYDAKSNGYKINYGEERMRGVQSTGGIFIEHEITNDEIKQKIWTED